MKTQGSAYTNKRDLASTKQCWDSDRQLPVSKSNVCYVSHGIRGILLKQLPPTDSFQAASTTTALEK